jgi:thiamine kinase
MSELDGVEITQVLAVGTRSVVSAFGADHVIKVPLASTPDSWIRAEAAYTEAVGAIGAPAPRLERVGELDGRSVSVFERIHGPSMWQHICDHPAEVAVMGRLLADLHHRLISLPVPISLPRQGDRLAAKIRRAAQHDPAVSSVLRSQPANGRGAHLCHGDLHPGNVLLSSNGPIVVDWFDASIGDPVGDVARSSILMGQGVITSELGDHLAGGDPHVVCELHDAYLSRIIELLGIDHRELMAWRAIARAAQRGEHANFVA